LKNNLILIIVILICPLFSYEVGETILETHQNKEFDNNCDDDECICYGDYPLEKFKLSDFQNKVIWLHFSATW